MSGYEITHITQEHDDDVERGALDAPQLPGFQVQRLLGVGGRSAVWLVRRSSGWQHCARWPHPGDVPPEQLALKLPLRARRTQPSIHSITAELAAMLPLHHPHVVRGWGAVSSSAGVGLLMDACTAGSLAHLLRSAGTLTPGETVTVLSPIAEACTQLHTEGTAHGDVSAANVLLTPEGKPMLADLGDAHLLGMPARSGSAEQDVHDLAALAWLCLTGKPPAGERQRPALTALRPDTPEQMTELLEAALSPLAQMRPTAAEFAQDLFAAAEPEAPNLTRHADDAVLAELPTRLPAPQTSPSGRAGRFSALRSVQGSVTPKAAALFCGAAAFGSLGWVAGRLL